jgi:GR25 family glycosyltransferase involved in LPS biosynthesis
MALNQFDAVVYINLNHRKDRENILLKDLDELGVLETKLHRIEAIHDYSNGYRGCAKSHIKALELAKEKKWDNILVLEDDVIFVKTPEEIEETIVSFLQSFNKEWDVFFLGASVLEYEETSYAGIKHILSAQCAHAYAVNNSYLDRLLGSYHEAVALMESDEFVHGFSHHAADQHWKKLQRVDRWYMGKLLAQQRRSYSDILHQIKERYHSEI